MAHLSKKMLDMFNPTTPVKKNNPTPIGEQGFDNIRENIDNTNFR